MVVLVSLLFPALALPPASPSARARSKAWPSSPSESPPPAALLLPFSLRWNCVVTVEVATSSPPESDPGVSMPELLGLL